MAVPVVEPFTARWWEQLPAVYRAGDEAQADGPSSYPLLRFLSLLGDQAAEVDTLYDRIALHDDGSGDWVSDLADPRFADPGWLNWLAQMAGLGLHVGSGSGESFAQLVIDYPTFGALAAANATFELVRHHGAQVAGGGGPDAARTALLDTTGARHAGSTGAWERLITPYLVGAKRVLHKRIFGGDAWHLRLETYGSETPSPAVVGAVIAAVAHAAGLTVSYATRSGASFTEVTAGFDDFAEIVADLPTFDALSVWLP